MFSASVPIFFVGVVTNLNWALVVFALVIEAFAFVHCLLQRAEAFPAIGTMSKSTWLALTGGSVLLTLIASFLPLLGMVAITVAAVYILDIRPALRDAVDGHGSW